MNRICLGRAGRCIAFLLFPFFLSSCLKDGDKTIWLEENGRVSGIPSDSDADPNPRIGTPTATVPNFQYSIEEEEGHYIVRLDMTGVQDPQTKEWLDLSGTGEDDQNIWIELDGMPKGIDVGRSEDAEEELQTDIVFLVDNSGSMSEEADAIARDIVSWAEELSNANMDVRFGCVGYESGVNGAIDLGSSSSISAYLNRYTGILRTTGYVGQNADFLEQRAVRDYSNTYGECGVEALRYADDVLSFRSRANRVYVNFTDEPNQPGGDVRWSVEIAADPEIWNTEDGTVHTVFSAAESSFVPERLSNEEPWRLSQYTGGTILYASPTFTGVSLSSLPVTGAMQNASVIRFTNIDELMDGKEHSLLVTILSEDGNVRAEKEFEIVLDY